MIDQGARLVDIALEDGSAFKLDGWKYIKESFAEHTLHFIGLLSDGGVHSRYDQLLACLKGTSDVLRLGSRVLFRIQAQVQQDRGQGQGQGTIARSRSVYGRSYFQKQLRYTFPLLIRDRESLVTYAKHCIGSVW